MVAFYRILFLIGILALAASGQEDAVSPDDTVTLLMNTNCSFVRSKDGDSLVELSFNFATGKAPQYYFEINRQERTLAVTLVHVRCGGFVIPDSTQKINIGPVKSMSIREDFKNINQDIVGMLPVLYRILIVTIACDPIVKEEGLSVHDNGTDVFLDFKWPADKKKRNEFYEMPLSKRHTGLIVSGTVVGAAGLAVGGFFFWKSRHGAKDSDILAPVLPEHP